MDNRLSRSFAAAEVILIVLPVSLMAFSSWLLIDFLGRLVESPVQRLALMALILISPALCVCGGILTALLAIRGPEALHRASKTVWAGMYAGATLTLSALLFELLGRVFQLEQIKVLDSHFGVFSLGAPMLIPVAHVVLSRRCFQSANKTMEPTR